jgi:TolB protein
MTIVGRVTRVRLMAAGAIVAAACGGCGRLFSGGSYAQRPTVPRLPAPPPLPDAPGHVRFAEVQGAPGQPQPQQATPAEDVGPGQVNIFGEMHGLKPQPVRPVADSGFQEHTYIDEGYDSDVAVDPTGKWLVFASTRDSVHPYIYMQRVDGASVVQLTSDAADDAYPTFSPDGKKIAFSSTRGGNWQIYVMDVDGKNVTQVTTGPMQAIHPSWSPDGTRIVFSSLGGRSGQWELWVINLGTNEKRMIGYGLFPTWGPTKDVDRIAFQRPRQRGSRWFGLWTCEYVNGEALRVTEVAVSSNAAILWPTWSPDGKRIAFATVLNPGKDVGVRPKGRTDIWTVNSDGSDRQRLTDGTGINLMPFWGSDGRVYFISDRGGAECIWSVRAETGKPFTVAEKKPEPEKAPEANAKEPGEQ